MLVSTMRFACWQLVALVTFVAFTLHCHMCHESIWEHAALVFKFSRFTHAACAFQHLLHDCVSSTAFTCMGCTVRVCDVSIAVLTVPARMWDSPVRAKPMHDINDDEKRVTCNSCSFQTQSCCGARAILDCNVDLCQAEQLMRTACSAVLFLWKCWCAITSLRPCESGWSSLLNDKSASLCWCVLWQRPAAPADEAVFVAREAASLSSKAANCC